MFVNFFSLNTISEATMPTKHDTTARRIADAKSTEYNRGRGPQSC